MKVLMMMLNALNPCVEDEIPLLGTAVHCDVQMTVFPLFFYHQEIIQRRTYWLPLR